MKSLICFKVGKKVTNSNETKEQVEQLQDKPSEETITEGEIKTDVGKQATEGSRLMLLLGPGKNRISQKSH